MTRAFTTTLRRGALLLAAGAMLAGCGSTPPLDATQKAFVQRAQRPGVTQLEGKPLADGGLLLGGELDGRQFALAVPKNWNGEAMLFAHGYTAPGTPIEVARNPLEKDPLGIYTTPYREGYAVGHSAYDKAGLAVESAVERTHRLRAYLGELGVARAYAVGASMGGDVVVGLIELYPQDFDGAFVGCGAVGGWSGIFARMIDVRAAYDYFARGTQYELPGDHDLARSALPLSSFGWLRTVQILRIARPITKLFEAAQKNPHGAEATMIDNIVAVAGVERDPASVFLPLATVALGMDDIVATVGGSIYDNTQKVYASPHLDAAGNAALNRGIARIKADPQAVQTNDRWYTPTGHFDAKLLTLYNAIDPLAPPSVHDAVLRRVVEAAGNGANLYQRAVPPTHSPMPMSKIEGYVHCGFNAAQVADAWNDMRRWVASGERPPERAVPAAP
jgi:dienelactone hydrolase